MSLPARQLDRPVPSPRRAAPPARVPATRPPIPNPPHPHRRARRGPHLRFWTFGLAIVCALAVGLVSMNAMRVDAAYDANVVQERLTSMLDERRTLVNDVARLSSPSRIGRWARANGLAAPAAGDVVILQVPGTAGV